MAQATSTTSTVTATALAGVWMHDPTAPVTTISNFLYGNVGRTEGIAVESKALRYVGRALPVYDMGGFESQNLGISVLIPGGAGEQDTADWFKKTVRSRQTLCYRDNRGRLTYGIIASINFEDRKEGTMVTFTFATTDFTEAV